MRNVQALTILIFNSFGDNWKLGNGDNFLTLSIYAFTEEQRKSREDSSLNHRGEKVAALL